MNNTEGIISVYLLKQYNVQFIMQEANGSTADLLAVQNAYFALRRRPSHPSFGRLAAPPGTAKPPQHFAKLNL